MDEEGEEEKEEEDVVEEEEEEETEEEEGEEAEAEEEEEEVNPRSMRVHRLAPNLVVAFFCVGCCSFAGGVELEEAATAGEGEGEGGRSFQGGRSGWTRRSRVGERVTGMVRRDCGGRPLPDARALQKVPLSFSVVGVDDTRKFQKMRKAADEAIFELI